MEYSVGRSLQTTKVIGGIIYLLTGYSGLCTPTKDAPSFSPEYCSPNRVSGDAARLVSWTPEQTDGSLLFSLPPGLFQPGSSSCLVLNISQPHACGCGSAEIEHQVSCSWQRFPTRSTAKTDLK
ncbi:hypothetical protein M747DRAFT_179001 [Aspergillus niger ATCC 13496]|nr:hypothetical protein M747DRAFT_179001 [Aspergillus niger ATCC 13496]